MAKIHLDRMRKKYGYRGEPYSELIQKILINNKENISRKMIRMNSSFWDKSLKKITPEYKRFIIPSLEDVLPKRSVFALKAAEQGKLIKDTLRDSLTKNLRDTLKTFTLKTGEANYIIRRGETAGRINPKLVKEFQSKITTTFRNYTKRDPKFKVPLNIKTIATTEIRSAISNIKNTYINSLVEKNPDLELKKIWIHNKSLSKVSRRGHLRLNNKKIPYNKNFIITRYRKIGKRWYKAGTIEARYPHDPNLPPEEVINCNCDIDYISRIKK